MKNMIETAVDKTILVSVDPYRTRVMLLENGVPVEFSMEKREEGRLVGNIYKGRVQNVLPGMFAAFIDINAEKNAFLYAGDVKEGSPLLEGEQIDGKLTPSMVCSIIKPGSDIMVQVVKEPIGTKGARVSTQISLPGRMLVFMPTVDFTGVSKRITNEAERKRLKALVSGLLPEGTGVIVRTAAEGVDDDMIRQELNSLIDEWEHIERRFRTGRSASLIHKEDSLIFRTVRDAFGAKLYRGNRVTKCNADYFNAFTSYNFPPLAEAGININYDTTRILTPQPDAPFTPHFQLETSVLALTLFPGLRQDIIEQIFSLPHIHGIVLRTFGSGNAPRREWLTSAIRQATQQGKVVVNITQCQKGCVEMGLYATGRQLMEAGVVGGGDMTVECAVTKLMYLFGRGYDPATVRRLMSTPLAGELL